MRVLEVRDHVEGEVLIILNLVVIELYVLVTLNFENLFVYNCDYAAIKAFTDVFHNHTSTLSHGIFKFSREIFLLDFYAHHIHFT